MKRKLLLAFFALLLTLLWGCGEAAAVDTRIQISLVAGDGYTVENNGLWVEPGADAEFVLEMKKGVSLQEVDYEGQYDHRLEDGKLYLTLKSVQYPERVRLFTTTRYCTITYDANGGEGQLIVKTYGLSYHKRPNTETGQKLFQRPDHSLVSWNTKPDGSGLRVGLGSRVTTGPELTLYAQWMEWSPVEDFKYSVSQYGKVTINKYLGNQETVVIPERIEGYPVTHIAANAFRDSALRHIVLTRNVDVVAPDAFTGSALETVTLFDNIQEITDSAFVNCENLRTLYINAIEAPYGYEFRRESVYADKVDMLILAKGQPKMIFYAGCSAWYNLNGEDTHKVFGDEYKIINMAINGTVNSSAQMQIMTPYLEAGDILIHTPELSSQYQLMYNVSMGNNDDKLWCGLEYNYDLFTLVDLRTVPGAFDSLALYLDKKTTQSSYNACYLDDDGNEYLDAFGCVPFLRNTTKSRLSDNIRLDPSYITDEGMARLEAFYNLYRSKGVRVYVSHACVNMDEVPEDQRGNVELMDGLFRDAFEAIEGVKVISRLEDYLYTSNDFYDTNFHLLSESARENTALWIRDIRAQLVKDGLWEGENE